jgi:type II secretory pathway pseudopilin PulG
MRSRLAFTVIELIVALLLLSVVVLVGAQAARVALGTQARVDYIGSRASALADARRTLRAHVRDAVPALGDLRAAQDTVLDVVHTLGSSVVCRQRHDTLVTSAPGPVVPWRSTMPRLVARGDMLRVWHEVSATWTDYVVRDARSAAGACGDVTRPWPDAPSQRLVLSDTLPAGLRPGAPVRVLLREKWSLVRGSDLQWSLSMATWDAVARRFGTPQPLVTGLAAPTAAEGAGLAVAARDSAGGLLSGGALARTHAVRVVLRAVRHPRFGAIADSVQIHVAHE